MPKNTIKKNDLHIRNSTVKIHGHQVDKESFFIEENHYKPYITKQNKHSKKYYIINMLAFMASHIPGIDLNMMAWLLTLPPSFGNQGKDKKGEVTSTLEVAFSEVALLFMKPGLTSQTRIITNDDNEKVFGVASEHFSLKINREIEEGKKCYIFDPNKWSYNKVAQIENIEQNQIEREFENLRSEGRIPTSQISNTLISNQALQERMQLKEASKAVNFLNKMPKGFFPDLMKKHQDKNSSITIDMESLASILVPSYVLEEDDLHKENIGFYVTDFEDKEGNPRKKFTFFKIDHDLMFTDSIMSQKDPRIANLYYNKDSFQISVRDLDGFPDLKDSGNHYWPTKERWMVKGDKAYTNENERKAFISLKDEPDFIHAKWKSFLKSAVIPHELIKKSLTIHLDEQKDIDKINQIRNALHTRISVLKKKLLESTTFRKYIIEHGEDAVKEIKTEIQNYCNDAHINFEEQNFLIIQLDEDFKLMNSLAKDKNLPVNKQKYTDIEHSIVLENYNFSSKEQLTQHDADTAYNLFIPNNNNAKNFSAACVALDVINKSLNKDPKKIKELQASKEAYLNLKDIKTLQQFKSAADKIRESNLPLKQQKMEIIELLKTTNLSPKDLKDLRKDLIKHEPSSPSLKFINQLRSELWIVRAFRGTYSNQTSTTKEIIKEIDKQIDKQTIYKRHSFFINCKENLQKITNGPNEISSSTPSSPSIKTN